MSHSITGAITNIQSKLAALSGMKSAPDTVPESIDVFPFGVSYVRSGEMNTFSADFANTLHTIYAEIHVSRSILPVAISTATGFILPFLTALMGDPVLGGSVASVNNVTYTFGTLAWAGVQTIGVRFEITVKIMLP